MLVTNLAILVLAGFVGYAVISKVPNTLHTPLMSGTNAIHGIVVLGGILVLGLGAQGALDKGLLVIATTFGTINVIGGFLVTDRMLGMFKGKKKPKPEPEEEEVAEAKPPGDVQPEAIPEPEETDAEPEETDAEPEETDAEPEETDEEPEETDEEPDA
jgi:NAD(P) transhydrogenase subunit alpha